MRNPYNWRGLSMVGTAAVLVACGPRPVLEVAPVVAPPLRPAWTSAVGCYDLRLQPWSPPVSLTASEQVVITPPSRILLDSAVGSRPYERGNLLLRPAPGAAPSIHRYSFWNSADRDSIHLRWTTGFNGLDMLLAVGADTLSGVAVTSWDGSRPRQSALVMAVRVPCDLAAAAAARRDSLDRDIPFATSGEHLTERGTFILHLAGKPIGRETYEIVVRGDTARATARTAFDGASAELTSTLTARTDGTPVRLQDTDGSVRSALPPTPPAPPRRRGRTPPRNPPEPAFPVPANLSPTMDMMLLREWLRRSRPVRLPLAPTGEGRIAKTGADSVLIGLYRTILERYAMVLPAWGRRTLWTDTTGHLVAIVGTVERGTRAEAIRQGFEPALPVFVQSALRDAVNELRRAAQDVKPTHTGTFALVGARVIDGTGAPAIANATVLVRDGRIAEIGKGGTVRVPAGTPTIRARDMAILPGLWGRARTHDPEWALEALASGVTSHRVPVGADTIAGLGAALAAGEALGPTLVPVTGDAGPEIDVIRSLAAAIDSGKGVLAFISSATLGAARAAGADRETGSLEPGKRADFVVVQGNPARRATDLRRVRWVAIGGRVYEGSALRERASGPP